MAAVKENILAKFTNDELMEMDKFQLVDFALSNGLLDELEKLFKTKTVKTRYPRMKVWDEEKAKYIYVADKSKEPKKSLSKPGFFEVKAKFFHEVCGLPYVVKEEAEDSFENLIKAAKLTAEYKASKEAK